MGFIRLIHSILFVSIVFFSNGQTDTLRYPMDTTPLLSGTFGEFRGSHFHAGIDLRTFGQIGLPIYSVESGYVSRIKISPNGYGKAIYVNHENGYTSVYGHLSGFNPILEAYIKKHQYEEKNFSVELFPPRGKFKITKGELIAFSGNTGGSYSPHVHFELRDTRTQEILNPINLTIPIIDSLPPLLEMVRLVKKDRRYKKAIGRYPTAYQVVVPSDSASELFGGDGVYALEIAARDLMTAETPNILGVYSVNIQLNGKEIYQRTTDRFSFKDSKYIHVLSSNEEGFAPLELTYKEPWIQHNLARYSDEGWFEINALNNDNSLKITLSDETGHSSIYHFKILHDETKEFAVEDLSTPENTFLSKEIFNKPHSFEIVSGKYLVDFFESAFLDTTTIYVGLVSGTIDTVVIAPTLINVSEKIRIIYNLPFKPTIKKRQLCIARKGVDGPEFIGGEANNGIIQAFTRSGGKYYLTADTLSPTIEFQSINSDSIQLILKDDFSGINRYVPSINGKWFLMEFDPKTGLLYGDLAGFLIGEKLEFEIIVEDNRGNTSKLKKTIYRP